MVNQVRKTNPTDLRLIAILAQAMDMLGIGCILCFAHLMLGDDISSLYEEASKKNPKDEDFGKQWFEKMILRGHVDGARKVPCDCRIRLISGCNGIK